MTSKTTLAASLLLASSLNCTAVSADEQRSKHHDHDKAFSFALIGDTPYGVLPGADSSAFDKLRKQINDDQQVRWVMHAGDIKSGSTPCSDEMFADRLQRYNQFEKPFILTLGDNEWTDCHRVKAGGYQPLERLSRLRETFFAQPGTTLGETKHLNSQAQLAGYEEFPENVMWQKGDVVFATMHIVGSNNALKDFDPAGGVQRTAADDAEVQRRTQAAIAWLNHAFDQAEQQHAAGMFLMIHANPVLEFKGLLTRDQNGVVARPGFTEFLIALAQRTQQFGKPVVLAHGDSHWFRVDKPELPVSADAADVFLPNFTRVETFGAAQFNWIKVTVKPDSQAVFHFSQQIVDAD